MKKPVCASYEEGQCLAFGCDCYKAAEAIERYGFGYDPIKICPVKWDEKYGRIDKDGE